MPVEKKKVNLVNLKTKFGNFLHYNYSCQTCYSVDKLTFGFTCDHKFCISCNHNKTDQCNECEAEIDDFRDDKLQNGLFKEFLVLKEIMGIDMKRVAFKLKHQLNNQQSVVKESINNNKIKKVDENCVNENDKNNQVCKEGNKKDQQSDPQLVEQNQVDKNKVEDELIDKKDKKEANRSSRRQVKEKSISKNESKKNNSFNRETEDKGAQIDSDQPKSAVAKRESIRTKEKSRLADLIKDATSEKILPEEAKGAEKAKSIRKTVEKSTKSNSTSKKSPPIVIIATSITDAELKLLDKFAKKFNAKVVNEFTEDITHLVTLEAKPNSKLTTRTLKYLKSLLAHKWLLDFKWVKDSFENNKLADESNYELIGITKQTGPNLGAPKRSRENSTVKLFEGKQFYIDGKFQKGGLPKKDYKDLVKVGGGEVIENENAIQEDTYIIIEASYSKSKFKGRPKSLSTTDFLNCISDFKFDL